MRFPHRTFVVLSVAALLASGCGQSGDSTPSPTAPASSSAPASSPLASPSTPTAVLPTPVPFFIGKVSVTGLPGCNKVRCNLPVQFTPKLVNDENVALATWPMDGDDILIKCVTTGKTYRDLGGNDIPDYYGAVVPESKLSPGAAKRATKVKGGYLGYVGISWVTGGEGKQVPDCKTLTK